VQNAIVVWQICPCNTLCHTTRTRVHRCPGHILCRTTGHISNAHMLPLNRYQWSLVAVLTRLSDCIPVSSSDGPSAATSTHANIHTHPFRMTASGHACVRMQSICRHTTHIRHACTHIVGKGLTVTAVLAQKPTPQSLLGRADMGAIAGKYPHGGAWVSRRPLQQQTPAGVQSGGTSPPTTTTQPRTHPPNQRTYYV
jgi:hypothetical protein